MVKDSRDVGEKGEENASKEGEEEEEEEKKKQRRKVNQSLNHRSNQLPRKCPILRHLRQPLTKSLRRRD